jgi:hypothetical protein
MLSWRLMFSPARFGRRQPGSATPPAFFAVFRVVAGAVVGPADEDLFGAAFVEFYFVDGGVEAVVVGAQGVEYRPHHPEALVVVEGFFGFHVGGHHDGDDDVAVFFARRAAHDAPDGLHHVHLRVAGGEEEHGIERGHVHAFREAADIGEDTAFAAILGAALSQESFSSRVGVFMPPSMCWALTVYQFFAGFGGRLSK